MRTSRSSVTAGRRRSGYSFVELVLVCTLLSLLSATAFPIAKFTVKRHKEIELRYSLRLMRNAIDEYKRFSEAGLLELQQCAGCDGYPEELESLTEAQSLTNHPPDVVKRFLRRVPIDPMTGEAEWGMRSYQDDPDSESWGGENVYDVFSLSEGTGLNGVPYSEW